MAIKKKAQLGMTIKKLVTSAVKKTPKKALTMGEKLAQKVEAKKLAMGLTKKEIKMGEDAVKSSKLNINKYNETPPAPFKLTAEQKANNERILKNINNKKNGGAVKKAQMGANFSKMKSQMEDFKKYDNVKKSPLSTGYMVPADATKKRVPFKGRDAKLPKASSSPSVLKKGGTIKKKK